MTISAFSRVTPANAGVTTENETMNKNDDGESGK
jgi:hypothetical protein